MKKFYSDITHSNLELIKNLKEELGDIKKKEQSSAGGDERHDQSHNTRLEAPLRDNQAAINQRSTSRWRSTAWTRRRWGRLRQEVAQGGGECMEQSEVGDGGGAAEEGAWWTAQRAELRAEAVRHASSGRAAAVHGVSAAGQAAGCADGWRLTRRRRG